jgi:nicotinamide mononucleotide adenylyltransferase/predicted kinase
MKFKEFLLESEEKHGVLAFGRMNPPTTGHEKLVNKVKEIAKEVGGEHHVVLSASQDKAKNPLSAAQKQKHAKRAFPNTNISVATKEHPTFLQHAAKLHKAGVTHLHMIAGSDRTEEYKKKLHQYNGTHKGALYNFKKITVHSSGERDPDAEGTEGMSASKMREHAKNGNYNEFKKGIPSHVSHEHAKEMYHDVRKGMGLHESVNEAFDQMLTEGVHDRGIFKAVFMAGGPGSGKDFVMKSIFGESGNAAYGTSTTSGLIEINSDKAFEYLMDQNGLDKKMPDSEDQQRDVLRGKAKNIKELRQRLAISGRNGLIINGTGDDPEKYGQLNDVLKKLGYETKMILVTTSDETSQERNKKRGASGSREVKEPIRKAKWEGVQKSKDAFKDMFGDDFLEFDNDIDLKSDKVPDELKKQKTEELLSIFKNVNKWIDKPVNGEQAKSWIGGQLKSSDNLQVSKQKPPAGSNASAQAQQMGLEYYGFGRYGKDGKTMYHSIHDRLVPVVKGVKESIDDDFDEIISESYGLSDDSSRRLLLLGTDISEEDTETRISTIDNSDISETENTNESFNREGKKVISEGRIYSDRGNSYSTRKEDGRNGYQEIAEEKEKVHKKISLNKLKIKLNLKPQNIDDEFGKTDQDDAIDGPEFLRPPLGSTRD